MVCNWIPNSKKTGYRIVLEYPFHLQKMYCQGSSTGVQRLLFLPSYLLVFKFTKYVLAILLAPLSLLVRLLAGYLYTALYVSVELEAHVSVLNTSGAGVDRAAEVLTHLTLSLLSASSTCTLLQPSCLEVDVFLVVHRVTFKIHFLQAQIELSVLIHRVKG